MANQAYGQGGYNDRDRDPSREARNPAQQRQNRDADDGRYDRQAGTREERAFGGYPDHREDRTRQQGAQGRPQQPRTGYESEREDYDEQHQQQQGGRPSYPQEERGDDYRARPQDAPNRYAGRNDSYGEHASERYRYGYGEGDNGASGRPDPYSGGQRQGGGGRQYRDDPHRFGDRDRQQENVGGFRQDEAGSRRASDDDFDPDYRDWRSQQMSTLDDDYRAYRDDRRKKFSDEFETYRKSRNGGASKMAAQQQQPSASAGKTESAGKTDKSETGKKTP